MSTTKKKPDIDDDPLVKSLRLVDPLLQFLTKKTQKTLVPFSLLKMVLPGGVQLERHQCLLNHIPELARSGILQLNNAGPNGPLSWNDTKSEIGFPSPPDQEDIDYSKSRQNLVQTGSLSGSTKTAAKRRLAALKKALKAESKRSPDLSKGSLPASNFDSQTEEESTNGQPRISSKSPRPEKDWDAEPEGPAVFKEELSSEEKEAFNALQNIFKFKDAPSSLIGLEKEEFSKNAIPQYVLPKQAAYAGSNPVQQSSFGELDEDVKSKIPVALLEAFGLGSPGKLARRRLYSHQATAINSAIRGCHTMVCTSTGSGKSLCFLLPALAAAYNASKAAAGIKATESFRGISLIMYPTKALAQDQLSKLKAVLKENEELSQHIVPATLDGDCSHEQRAYAAKHANILLTNPDTLHSAILPNWEKLYKRILTLLAYVVIDEAHVYEGVFGAHVALVLSRLHRLCVAAGAEVAEGGKLLPTFLASSATLAYPEHHLRLLCPISKHGKVVVLTPTDDGSPRSSKHFFVWNPPLLSMDGTSTASVEPQSKSKASGTKATQNNVANKRRRNTSESVANSLKNDSSDDSSGSRALVLEDENNSSSQIVNGFQRRHAADETALLLARAITNNVRCIAFCKTRMVVEWVYEVSEFNATTRLPMN